MNYVELARCICKYAHDGQVDKAGVPYFNHPFNVASYMSTDDEKIVAYLHDVLEDTSVSLQDIKKCGFNREVLQALQIITKKAGDSYESYIEKVATNKIAKKVKIADLIHNSDLTRIANPSKKDYARCEKYKKAIIYLSTH